MELVVMISSVRTAITFEGTSFTGVSLTLTVRDWKFARPKQPRVEDNES